MTADLSREQLDRYRHPGLHFLDKGGLDVTVARGMFEHLLEIAEAHLSEQSRLAAARAEGYREGIEAAIADAVAVSIRDEVDSYEMRDDGGGGYSPTDDERIMLEDFGAGLVAVFEQRLRALTPPPAEPAQPDDGWIEWKGGECPLPEYYRVLVRYRSKGTTEVQAGLVRWTHTGAWDDIVAIFRPVIVPAEPSAPVAEPADWTVSDTELARDILCYLGIGSDASLEPGDRRRDRIAAMICADRERRIVKPATRITALEAENAALWERNGRLVEGLHDLLGRPTDGAARVRARALLQGQGGGDA